MPRSSCLALITLTVLLSLGRATALGAEPPAAKKVVLVIDYGDGVQKHFRQIPWKEKMTVLGALQAAARHPRGIRFEHRGSGATALLTKIDNLSNEGGGGRNWIFRVNGSLGDRSFGAANLKANDTVLWKFGKYR